MFNISSFFERFKNKELDEIAFRAAIAHSIGTLVRAEIGPDDISYSNNIVFLRLPPAAKASVFLKKTEILSLIQKSTKKTVLDIR